MKRIGETVRPGIAYRDRMGVYALVAARGRILCVCQSGEMQLPGGGIDPGEHPLAALHREVREETGWSIAGPDGGMPRRIHAFQRYVWLWDYDYWARKVQAIYLARPVARLGPPTEVDHDPVWLTPAQALGALDIEGDRQMVARAWTAGLIG